MCLAFDKAPETLEHHSWTLSTILSPSFLPCSYRLFFFGLGSLFKGRRYHNQVCYQRIFIASFAWCRSLLTSSEKPLAGIDVVDVTQGSCTRVEGGNNSLNSHHLSNFASMFNHPTEESGFFSLFYFVSLCSHIVRMFGCSPGLGESVSQTLVTHSQLSIVCLNMMVMVMVWSWSSLS